jgi:hypothetical protein
MNDAINALASPHANATPGRGSGNGSFLLPSGMPHTGASAGGNDNSGNNSAADLSDLNSSDARLELDDEGAKLLLNSIPVNVCYRCMLPYYNFNRII